MRFRSTLTILTLTLVALSSSQANPPFPAKPKLVVLIAIDQFRYDYLTRYEKEFTGGLHRMVTEGAVFANANLAHVVISEIRIL